LPTKALTWCCAICPTAENGTTACKWDSVIPFEPLWKQYERVIKDNGAIVLFSAQPFTTALIHSKILFFKYSWVWDKVQPSNFLNARIQPLRQHEDINVFYKKQCLYNRQFEKRKLKDQRVNAIKNKQNQKDQNGQEHTGKHNMGYSEDYDYTKINPKSIISFTRQPKRIKLQHPTQKPIALMEYLIKTYTNKGETVLDNCMGSGTTGVACKKSNRNFIGIEKDETYFKLAVDRVSAYCG